MSFGGSGGGGSIHTDTDVVLSNPVTGHFLEYNGSTSKWQNTTLNGWAALPSGGGLETLSALGSKSGTTAINLANGNVFTVTLGGNVTFTFSGATASTACSFGLYINSGAGSRTVTWPGSVKWAGGTAPTLTSVASATDVLVFESLDGGTSWYGSLVGANFS